MVSTNGLAFGASGPTAAITLSRFLQFNATPWAATAHTLRRIDQTSSGGIHLRWALALRLPPSHQLIAGYTFFGPKKFSFWQVCCAGVIYDPAKAY